MFIMMFMFREPEVEEVDDDDHDNHIDDDDDDDHWCSGRQTGQWEELHLGCLLLLLRWLLARSVSSCQYEHSHRW